MTAPRRALAEGAATRIVLDARDVTLALAAETATSALDTPTGAVSRVEQLPDGASARVRAQVAGAGEIVALVTLRSVAALGLAEGAPVLARLKATAVR